MSFPFALSSAALGVVALLVAGCSPAAPAPERDAQAAVHGPAADQHGAGKPRHRNTIQTVTLIGADGHRAVLAAADLATLPRERFSFDRHGEVRTYEGPLLLDVMALVGAGATPLHAPDLATVVLIESADGYQVRSVWPRRIPPLAPTASSLRTVRTGRRSPRKTAPSC